MLAKFQFAIAWPDSLAAAVASESMQPAMLAMLNGPSRFHILSHFCK